MSGLDSKKISFVGSSSAISNMEEFWLVIITHIKVLKLWYTVLLLTPDNRYWRGCKVLATILNSK